MLNISETFSFPSSFIHSLWLSSPLVSLLSPKQNDRQKIRELKVLKGIKNIMEREIVCTLQIENKEESKNIREERQREKTREKNIVV